MRFISLTLISASLFAAPGFAEVDNRAVATSFFNRAFIDKKPREAVEKFVDDAYIQQSLSASDGKQSVANSLEAMVASVLDMKYRELRTAAGGDLVYIHSLITSSAMPLGQVCVDFLRVEGG